MSLAFPLLSNCGGGGSGGGTRSFGFAGHVGPTGRLRTDVSLLGLTTWTAFNIEQKVVYVNLDLV
jgi:hypothetical protein